MIVSALIENCLFFQLLYSLLSHTCSSSFALRQIPGKIFTVPNPFLNFYIGLGKFKNLPLVQRIVFCNCQLVFPHCFLNLVFVYLCACLCHFLLQFKRFDLTTICLYIFSLPSRTWMSKIRKFSQGIKSSKGLYECLYASVFVYVFVCAW